MVKNLLIWLAVFPLVLALVLFSISNRTGTGVQISLNHSIDVPVYGIFWAGLLVGFFIGWVACWFNGSAKRQRLNDLENQNSDYKSKLSDAMDKQTQLKARVLDASDQIKD